MTLKRYVLPLVVALTVLAGVGSAQEYKDRIPKGDASISGRVIGRDGERPIAGARVSLIDPRNRRQLSATTAEDGTYAIENFAAGIYYVRAEHPQFVESVYGSNEFVEGLSIVQGAREFVSGARVRGIDFVLERGATFRGQVTDPQGNPIAGASVFVGFGRVGGRLISVTSAITITDRNGNFSITGIRPGEYFVQAAARQSIKTSPDIPGSVITDDFESSFYPGVKDSADAAYVRAVAGETTNGINIPLPRIEYFNITGYVVASTRPEKLELILAASPNGSYRAGSVKEDGSFSFNRLKPGRYVLWARTRSEHGTEAASLSFLLDRTLEDVRLELATAGRLAGRVVTERGDPLPIEGFRIAAALMDDDIDIDPRRLDQVEVAADGRFAIEDLFGDRALRVFGLPDGWQVTRIESGRAVVERFTMIAGTSIDDIVVFIGQR